MGHRQSCVTKVTSTIRPRISRSSVSKPEVMQVVVARSRPTTSSYDDNMLMMVNNETTSSPESVMTELGRESLSHDSIQLEKLTLDTMFTNKYEQSAQSPSVVCDRVPIDFNRLPDDHKMAFRPIGSDDIGFGIDASFVESSQHFITRRHRAELIAAQN